MDSFEDILFAKEDLVECKELNLRRALVEHIDSKVKRLFCYCRHSFGACEIFINFRHRNVEIEFI